MEMTPHEWRHVQIVEDGTRFRVVHAVSLMGWTPGALKTVGLAGERVEGLSKAEAQETGQRLETAMKNENRKTKK